MNLDIRPGMRDTHPGVRERIVAAVRAVCDPEIPVLTIADLGILRDVVVECGPAAASAGDDGDEVVARVRITPTYSGCPAMDTIRDDLVRAARAAGAHRVEVELVLSPAWTTDWMTEEGAAKLREYGIAPPTGRAAVATGGPVPLGLAVKCPRCHSLDTRELTRFGSTACKALYQCRTCREPFDHFKAH